MIVPPNIQIDSIYKHFDKAYFAIQKRMKLYPEPTDQLVKQQLLAIRERLSNLEMILQRSEPTKSVS